MIVHRIGLAAALVVVALSGCGGPAPTPAPPTGAPSTSPGDAALIEQLRVRSPKDLRGLPPCGLLTTAQLSQLGLQPKPYRQEARASGAACDWPYADDPANLAGYGTLVDAPDPPMPGIYYTREASVIFEPTVISGHPAVRDEQVNDDNCNLEIAVADDQLLSVSANSANRPGQDACGLARRMAEMILAALPPKR